MLGRRILTRITRLGLSMYAMIWCMSFTVCAYDDPIADMAVGSRMALLSEITEVPSEGVDGPEDPEISPTPPDVLNTTEDSFPGDASAQPGEDDAVISEEGEDATTEDGDVLIEDDAEGEPIEDEPIEDEVVPEEEPLEAALNETKKSSKLMGTEGIVFDVDGITITTIYYNAWSADGNKSFSVSGIGGLETLDPENITYTLVDVSPQEWGDYITLGKKEDGTGYIYATYQLEGAKYLRCKIKATYTTDDGEYTATCPVVVYVPCWDIDIGVNGADYYYKYIRDWRTNNNITFDIIVTEVPCDLDRISWEFYDVTDGNKTIDFKTMDPDYLSLTEVESTRFTYTEVGKTLWFGKNFTDHTIGIRAIHDNTYVDALNHTIYANNVTDYKELIPRWYPTASEIKFETVNTTLRRINESFPIKATDQDGNPLDSDYLQYFISPTGTLDDLTTNYNGVRIDYSAVTFPSYYSRYYGAADDFYVVARYNQTEEMYSDFVHIKVVLPVKDVAIYWGDTNMDGQTWSGDTNWSIWLDLINSNKTLGIDGKQVHWTYEEVIDGETVSIPDPDARGLVLKYDNDFGIELRNRLTIYFRTTGFKPGLFKLTANYDNKYKDVDGNPIVGDELSSTFYINISRGYNFNVTQIMLGDTEYTIESNKTITIPITGAIAENGSIREEIPATELDPYRLRWGITKPGDNSIFNISSLPVTWNQNKTVCTINVGELTDATEYDLVARYYNKGYPYDYNKNYVEERAHLTPKLPIPDVEAHLSEAAVKVQVYNGNNLVPVTIRDISETSPKYLSYRIKSVTLTDPELSKYVTAVPSQDGRSINLQATDDAVNELSVLLKKKYTTGVNITANVYGNVRTLMTLENLTVTFGSTKLATKDVTVDGTLEFDSYYNTKEIKAIPFSGAKVKEVVPVDAKALAKLGFEVVEGTTYIKTTANVPTTKSGSFKVKAILDDSEINHMEPGYSVVVTVKYKVISTAPKLTVDKTTITLNPKTQDRQVITLNLTGVQNDYTDVKCKLLDSKNNEAKGMLTVSKSYYYGSSSGTVTVSTNSNTTVGATYKLQIMPYSTAGGREGAAKTVTIKTVTAANAAKTGITIKAAGGLDVYAPSKILYLTSTGKNLDLYGKKPVYLNITLKNGTEITRKFELEYTERNNTLWLAQQTEGVIGSFPFFEQGLAGQTINIKLGYNTTEGIVNGTYSTKIAATKFTPKLGLTKVSVNPDYMNKSSFVDIPITDYYSGYYNYSIALDDGKSQSVPLVAERIGSLRSAVIRVKVNGTDPSTLAGKTFSVKITPDIPDNKGGTSVCKITFLNPAKSKASVTAKAKGSIDAVKDGSNVTITLTYKNTYVTNNTYRYASLIKITKAVKGKEQDVTYMFNRNGGYYNDPIVIRRGGNLEAGTYKAYVSGHILDKDGRMAYINTTVSFKVVRSKTGTTVKPSLIKLINRDYVRSATLYIAPKTAGVNAIRTVKITGAYNESMRITKTSDGVYKLEFVEGHVEGSKGKKGWQVLTKYITKSVPLEVYYQGSTTPDKVSAKVKINP